MKKQLSQRNSPFSFYSLILIVLLIRFPNFYLILHGSFFLTHTIARILLIFLTILLLIRQATKARYLAQTISPFIWIYFMGISLSIVHASNLLSFFTIYKDIIFSLLLFISVYLIIDSEFFNQFLWVLCGIVCASLVMELSILFYPQYILPVLSYITHETYLQYFSYQYQRGRLFGDSLNEAFIPILFIVIIAIKNRALRFGSLVTLSSSLLITTLVSGWRTKLVVLFISSICTLLFLAKKQVRLTLLILLFSTMLVTISYSYLSGQVKILTSVERLFNLDVPTARENRSRISYLKEAIEVGASSPLFGVGLGNYFDSLSQKSKETKQVGLNGFGGRPLIIIDDPHNMFIGAFATTGIIGVISLILLMSSFAWKDVRNFFHLSSQMRAVIISFWSIVLFAFFNPWLYFQYLSLFWMIRGLIEKGHYIFAKSHEER